MQQLSTILHPKLIGGVSSDSTETFDRRDKCADYKTIPELEEYVLVHQKQMLVERFERKSDNLWVPQIVGDRDMLELKSIGFSAMVATLYENTNLLT
jgi:Uma2 family endonuclease